MTENSQQQDAEHISNLIEVRMSAMNLAVSTNNPLLYAAAVANKDERILDIVESLMFEADAVLADGLTKLGAVRELTKLAIGGARLREAFERLHSLAALVIKARANVDLLRSGSAFPDQSTEALLALRREIEAAKGADVPAQAG